MINKMYPVKILRRRKALRLAAMVTAVGVSVTCNWVARADNTYIGSSGLNWNTANTALWSAGVPAAGQTVDIFKNVTVVYGVTSAVDLTTLQISSSIFTGNTSNAAVLSITNPSNALEAGNLYLGAGATSNTAGGAGQVSQSAGSVTLDPGGLLNIDSLSTYSLSSSGYLSAYTEQNAGFFNENSGSNLLAGGYGLTNSGSYTLFNSGTLAADTITNTGNFNQASSSMVRGTTTGNVSFSNSGTYLYSSGTFTGLMTNNQAGLVSISTSAIPFSQGIVNNGQMTVLSTGLNASTGTYAGPITGSGSLLFNGTGVITLTGTNAFAGTTSVAGGTLALSGPVGTSANNYGGSLQGNISVGTAGTLLTNAASQIANNTTLTVNGGIVNLNGTDQTVATLNLSGGQIVQSASTNLGLGVASGQVNLSRGFATITGGLRSSSNFNFNISNNATLAVANVIDGYSNSSTGLVLTGGGTLSIYGSSNLSSIDVQQGILQIVEGGNFNGSNVSTTLEAGGTLSLQSQSLTLGNLLGTGAVSLGTGTLTVNGSGSTFSGTITGTGSLVKTSSSSLVIAGADFSTGTTAVSAGMLTLASTVAGSSVSAAGGATVNLNGALTNAPIVTANGTINIAANTGSGIYNRATGAMSIGSGGALNVAYSSIEANRTVLVPSSLVIAGSTNAWLGQLDLANNDLVVAGGNLSTLTNQVKSGISSNTGITSSTAAANTTHLTALGVIQNANSLGQPLYGSGTALGLFDGTSPAASAVLIKYTYFGDANLDGKIDGSDYSRLDNGYLNTLTGWYNGDFNYDGTINGSDYTLIDNAFNTQGAAFAAVAATPTAQIAGTTAVPEPIGLSLLALPALALLRRRHQA